MGVKFITSILPYSLIMFKIELNIGGMKLEIVLPFVRNFFNNNDTNYSDNQ